MSDRSALILALLVLGAILADVVFNGSSVMFFLLLKFADLVEYLAFWR